MLQGTKLEMKPRSFAQKAQQQERREKKTCIKEAQTQRDLKSYLGRNNFDEFIEKTEFAHFTVKPFPAVFHTSLQDLEIEG